MKKSAGILPYRKAREGIEVFLVHPGGPFWKNRDVNAWSVAKGEFTYEEMPFHAALREFQEETGLMVSGDFLELTPVKMAGGKQVFIWAVEADFDPETIKSNIFKLEWPPRSGILTEFPEIDKAGWFPLHDAHHKIHKGQIPVLNQLMVRLNE